MMILIITFIFGSIIGWLLAALRQSHIEKQTAKRKFSDEIELRATPDTYLSEFDLIRKRYYEAKFKKMTEPMLNRKGIPMTEEEIRLRKASQKQ
ncbi:hypothetical protein [Prochlorococcus marinus]|uniref:hypothetical protein n=1 Tax=Prochlorococcus marinus TaxID=1219 RepID=UPI0022B390B1|nr:hypothetical protein [Prochlorococcus marinus]